MSYTRCSFKSVVDLVLAYAGQARSQITDVQALQVNGFINQRLRDWAWIAWPWPELTPVELRRYREDYGANTAYAAPTASAASEVYFPATQQYYQALRATTGNAPALLNSGVYTVNADYWAIASGPYSGADWADATAYTVGAIVRNPADGRYYQCYSAHTSSGILDTAKFGILTIFDPFIARAQSWEDNVIGEFLGLYIDNPLTEPRPRRVMFMTDAAGAHIQTRSRVRRTLSFESDTFVPNQVYARFRLPCPDFVGSAFDELETYSADADVIYFEGDTTDLEGDYWRCVAGTTAGQSPATNPEKWERIDFPLWLRTPVARRAFADWLRYGSLREDAAREDAEANVALFQAQLQAGSQQGQIMRWRKSA